MKIDEEFVTISEVQAKISDIIRSMEAGKRFVIMRYSKPEALIMNFNDYKELLRLAKIARGGACRVCKL